MKNFNKHILEAITRGVQIALDDFEDIEQNKSISQKNNVNYNEIVQIEKDSTFCQLTMTVDLGLPSGTLWCKYNLGVDPNKLNNVINWYGDYYAWGETETKTTYNSDTYFFDLHPYYIRNYAKDSNRYKNLWNEAYQKINKYDRFSKVGYIEMNLEDDVAYIRNSNMMNNNFKYCIPTREQFREMVRSCHSKNVYNYKNISGLNGKLFISKINGNELFIPFNGFKGYTNITMDGEEGLYWTSSMSLDEFTCAQAFKISNEKNKDEKTKLYDNTLYNGFGIRPVLLQTPKRPKFRVEVGGNKITYYN